jgi:DNA-binding winged helix-turn-helix (wHTH) protein
MRKRFGDIVSERAHADFVGRECELEALLGLFEQGGPLVFHVHGIAGIGKSSLLGAFASLARDRGAAVVRIDCRAVEPIARGFLAELSEALGQPLATIEDAAARLSSLGKLVVIALDTYEAFHLLDAWIRHTFVATLPLNTRVLIAGRSPPSPAWRTEPGWKELFRALRLEPLSEKAALGLLARSSVTPEAARRINRLTRGHPLALNMAASLAKSDPSRAVEDVGLHQVIDALSSSYVEGVPDPVTRQALEASSVIRCVTEPMLHALLPGIAPRDAIERLGALPFVELGRDGLFIHDAVRSAIATSLAARDPDAHRAYRHRAWAYLHERLQRTHSADLWRFMADLLFLIENPVLREGFFPSGPHPLAVESATPGDAAALQRIVAAHGADLAAHELWWRHHPRGFHIVRDHAGTVCGFYAMIRGCELHQAVAAADPVAAAWSRSAAARGPASTLFVRGFLDRDVGEAPSATQAACWVDIKRTYLELRTTLRYVYMCLTDPSPYAEVTTRLGFRQLEGDAVIDFAAQSSHSFVLDMGPGSIDAWLAELVGQEISSSAATSSPKVLDIDAHELVLPSGRIGLTSLELGVMRYLEERPGKVVSRYDLMAAVWGHKNANTSNVVDVVIRSLRRKLGEQADVVETVRGTGYRYRSPARAS